MDRVGRILLGVSTTDTVKTLPWSHRTSVCANAFLKGAPASSSCCSQDACDMERVTSLPLLGASERWTEQIFISPCLQPDGSVEVTGQSPAL